MRKRLSVLLALLMLLISSVPGISAGERMQIPVSFWVFGNHVYTDFAFPYSDEWFLEEDSRFSPELAQGSLGLAFSAFRAKENLLPENQYEAYLAAAGFGDIHAFGYDHPTGTDTFSGVMARKKIGGFTLIAVAGCGQGYDKEWGGNFRLGTGARHEGFDAAREILMNEAERYLAEKPVEGPLKLWITGYSRAAAAANLAAADWTESGRFDAVYAYCFACPRNTREPAGYPNIFNICGTQDPVSQLPMESYGYERNGTDLYLPSQETHSGYAGMKDAASKAAIRLTGKPLFSNPAVNLDLRLANALLCRIFPVTEEYTAQYQNTVVSRADRASDDAAEEEIVPALMAEMLKAELRDEGIGFLSMAAALASSSIYEYTGRRLDRQIAEGSWDPDDLFAVNLLREHMPTTYAAWMFSGLPEEALFRPAETERILFLDRCESLTVIRGEEAIWEMEGNRIRKLQDDMPGFLMSGPGMAVLILPADGDYRLEFRPRGGALKALEVMISPARTLCDRCVCHTASSRKDSYTLTLRGQEPMAGAALESTEAPCSAEDLIFLKSLGFGTRTIRNLFSGAAGK